MFVDTHSKFCKVMYELILAKLPKKVQVELGAAVAGGGEVGAQKRGPLKK